MYKYLAHFVFGHLDTYIHKSWRCEFQKDRHRLYNIKGAILIRCRHSESAASVAGRSGLRGHHAAVAVTGQSPAKSPSARPCQPLQAAHPPHQLFYR